MIRTLIVEDDFRVAAIHRAYTERLPGFMVVGEARSGAQALDLVERTRPDLVLLDIYLPDLPGLEVLRRLREPGRPPVDIIAITAAREGEMLRGAMQGGVLQYLVKPFQFHTFREKLEGYAALRSRLAKVQDVDQAEVDKLYTLLRTAAADALPKGLSAATLALVARVMRERQSLSAADVARLAGVSRVTARRYLEHLCRSGRVELTMRYGRSGRPEHRYCWSAT